MLSLDNAFDATELVDFERRLRDRLGEPDLAIEYSCEPKLDGIAVSLLYRDGILERGATRGDGPPVRTSRTMYAPFPPFHCS